MTTLRTEQDAEENETTPVGPPVPDELYTAGDRLLKRALALATDAHQLIDDLRALDRAKDLLRPDDGTLTVAELDADGEQWDRVSRTEDTMAVLDTIAGYIGDWTGLEPPSRPEAPDALYRRFDVEPSTWATMSPEQQRNVEAMQASFFEALEALVAVGAKLSILAGPTGGGR